MNMKYKRLFKSEREDGQFWPSFTDLLTTILLCFILIFITMMVIKSLQIKEILIAYDKANLKDDAFQFLDEFVPKYLDVLLESGYEDYIAEIIIEGHTDRDGTYLYNLELAQDRAYSVAKYVLSEDFPYPHIQEHLEKKLTVNSKSYTDYRTDEEGNYHADASRRVEFKFRLKDEDILHKTREILQDS